MNEDSVHREGAVMGSGGRWERANHKRDGTHTMTGEPHSEHLALTSEDSVADRRRRRRGGRDRHH